MLLPLPAIGGGRRAPWRSKAGGMDDEVIRRSASSPSRSPTPACAVLRAEQVEVAALHEVQAVAHETDRLGAQAVVAERRSPRHTRAEQGLGDRSIVRPVERTIERAQGELEATTTVGAERSRGDAPGSRQPQQALGGREPVLEQRIERQHDADRTVSGRGSQDQSAARWREGEEVEVVALVNRSDGDRLGEPKLWAVEQTGG